MKQFTSFGQKQYSQSVQRVSQGFLALTGKPIKTPKLVLFIASKMTSALSKELAVELRSEELEALKTDSSKKRSFLVQGDEWRVVIVDSPKKNEGSAHKLDRKDYGVFRDSVGENLKSSTNSYSHIELRFYGVSTQGIDGALCGAEMASYKFLDSLENQKFGLSVFRDGQALTAKLIESALKMGRSVNLARHLVNLPPSHLNPHIYTAIVKALFKNDKNVKVEVWQGERLVKEKMGLMLGVGEGALYGPAMVKISYKGSATPKSPKVFIGKGITFDTGGLDLKPAQYMRLMKKDMGGSAAVLGLAFWTAITKQKGSAEFYLALAENAISDKAFKPSDVLTARNGKTVEIHNTDAEGRLVMADVLAVATEKKNSRNPEFVIDVATLTGAMKVGLGNDVAGFFSNDEKLAKRIEKASLEGSDPVWRMPLVDSYKSQLKSPFADLVNCGDGMGGAITAALFLQEFVESESWAHFDILAWQNASGPFAEIGGSGQAVQLLSRLFANS